MKRGVLLGSVGAALAVALLAFAPAHAVDEATARFMSFAGGLVDLATGVTGQLPDANVSDTLTASKLVGSGSTTDAVDLATAEVNGQLADANVSNTLTASIFVGSGSSTNAVDLATAEVSGSLPDANVSDTLTCSIVKGSGTTTDAVDLATAEVAGTLPVANGGTGASSLAALCQVSGGSNCTMTGSVIGSGVTSDFTAASGEDTRLVGGASSGSAQLQSIDNQTEFLDSSSNVDGQWITSSSIAVSFLRQGNSSTSGGLGLYSAQAWLGSQTDVGATTLVGGIAESMGLSSTTNLLGVYGGGLVGVPTQQSITISTGTDTTTPTSSQVELTCTTPACTYSPGETSIPDGVRAKVCNVDATDNISLATSAGVVVVTGSPRVLTPGECADCTYSGAIWGCT